MAQNRLQNLANYSVVLIALLALGVSIWQVRIFQNHNKLTVKPYLDSHIVHEDSTLVISFSNKGLGPAIIDKMSFEIGGKSYETIFELLEAEGEKENMLWTYHYPKGSVLSSGEKKLLAKLLHRRQRGIQVAIRYESIYEEVGEINFSF